MSGNQELVLAHKDRLGEAIAKGWVDFWYQPKVDLRTKTLAGVESLARLSHPERGMLPPGEFLTGAGPESLAELSNAAVVSALRAANRFMSYRVNIKVAVNVASDALTSLSVDRWIRQYAPTKANWSGMILDLSEEHVARNFEDVRTIAEEFQAYKVRFAIDDFGGGHLPFAKLSELPLAELKIAREVVHGCADNLRQASIARAVVAIAHEFGATAVGIGIERQEDLHMLRDIGCDLGQGYLFGQPMPYQTLDKLLRRRVGAEAA